MATHQELFEITSNTVPGSQALRNKVSAAVIIAADIISSGNDTVNPPWDQAAGAHDQRIKWAVQAFQDPFDTADELFSSVIAANASATQVQILNATDNAIQANVNAVVDTFSANIL